MPTQQHPSVACTPVERAEDPAVTDQVQAALSHEETARLLDDLRAQQVELQAQNEELRRAQVELQRSRELYVELYDMAPVGYVMLTAQARILEANLRAADLLGMPRGELAGQPLERFILPPDSDAFFGPYRDLVRTGKPQSCDVRLTPREGDPAPAWVHLEMARRRACPQDDPEKAARWAGACHVVISDITRRKRAEAGLWLDAEKYRGLLESLNSMVAVVTSDARILYMNDRAARELGLTPEALAGSSLYDVFPAETVGRQMEAVAKVIAEDRGAVMEVRIDSPAGSRWFRESIQPIHDEAGKVVYALINSTDISDLMLAREELEALNRHLEQRVRERSAEAQDLYDHAPCGYHSLDAEGYFIMVNETELDWLGYTRDELIGQHMSKLASPPHAAHFRAAFDTFMVEGRMPSREIEMVRKDGTILPVIASAVGVFDEDGQFKSSRTTLFDITERKRAEETLRLANVEMQRALRLKDEFLASMSHELRTPLSAVLSLSEALTEEIGGPLTEKQRRYVQIIAESGNYLLELINSILDLARINAGKLELDLTKVDVDVIPLSCLRMVKELATKKGQHLLFETDPSIGVIMADARRLRQMLVNLLSNAVKFTPDGGRIGLQVSGDAQNRTVNFTVWDTGIGIKADDLPHLFDPFVQLDSSLGRAAGGAGLGLALVSQMAALHGGAVSVESEPDKGSRFTISIPWLAAAQHSHSAAAAAVEEAGAQPDGGQALPAEGDERPPREREPRPRATLLVVDDSEVSRLVMSDYLTSRGYAVVTAADGRAAVTEAVRARPDLILMDVMMPGIDGIAATRNLRTVPELERTPIIALTALVMPGDRERCLTAGMDDYLSKPVQFDHLAEVIARWLPAVAVASGS